MSLSILLFTFWDFERSTMIIQRVLSLLDEKSLKAADLCRALDISTYPLIERIRMSEIDNIFFTPLLAIKIVFEYIIHAREPKIKSHIIKFFFN